MILDGTVMSDTILSTYNFILTTLDSQGLFSDLDPPWRNYDCHVQCVISSRKIQDGGFYGLGTSYGIVGYGSLRKEKNPYTLGIMSAHL